MPAQADLLAEGWVKRNVASGPRVAEVAGLYRELGMEVLVVDFSDLTGSSGECEACLGSDEDKVIFTRGGG